MGEAHAAAIAVLLCACSSGSGAQSGGDAGGPVDAGDAAAPPATDATSADAPASADAFVCPFTLGGDAGDALVDSRTGLQWAVHITPPESWSDAFSTCGTWGGRVPLEVQIADIVVPVNDCVAAGALSWDGPPAGQAVWTRTPDPLDNTAFYTVFFDGTPPASEPQTALEWVRCVR